jgi:hypothetical protein
LRIGLYKKVSMRKFFEKQKLKRNVSALVVAGIIIVGGYVIRRAVNNKSKVNSIENNLESNV